MKAKLCFIILSGLFIHQQAVAGNSINDRQHKQATRIVHGVANGELTAKETLELSKQQARIAKTEAKFKSDGKFTKRERAIVHKKQNRASRNIYRQKHDNQTQN